MEEYQVLDELKKIAGKIEKHYPRFVPKKTFAHRNEAEQEGLLNDLQKRLAEIYAVIQEELKAKDKRLNLTYQEALQKHPNELKKLLNLFFVLAICIKTKLNLGSQLKLLDPTLINAIDDIAFHCYNLTSLLANEIDPKLTRDRFNKGFTDTLEYTYSRTGIRQRIAPGLHAGQLMSTRIGELEQANAHNSLIENARKSLDQNTPAFEATYIAGKKEMGEQLKVTYQPQGLAKLVAGVVGTNKPVFAAGLQQGGAKVTDVFPELDVDYRATFIREVKKVIDGVTFVPSEQEAPLLAALAKALSDEKSAHDAIHRVIVAQRMQFKQAFFSPASHVNINAIHTKIISLMKQYQLDKAEYEKSVASKSKEKKP